MKLYRKGAVGFIDWLGLFVAFTDNARARVTRRQTAEPNAIPLSSASFVCGAPAHVYGATLHFSVSFGLLLQARVFFRVLDRTHEHRQGVLPEIHKNLPLHCI